MWIDGALKKATHPDPYKRYETLTEFIVDLETPNKKFLKNENTPLVKRNPLIFWQSLCFILALIILYLPSK